MELIKVKISSLYPRRNEKLIELEKYLLVSVERVVQAFSCHPICNSKSCD